MTSDLVRDVEVASLLIVSGAYCLASVAQTTALTADRVLAAFRRIEKEWGEPLVDTAPCATCRKATTVYALRLPSEPRPHADELIWA